MPTPSFFVLVDDASGRVTGPFTYDEALANRNYWLQEAAVNIRIEGVYVPPSAIRLEVVAR